MGMKKKIMAAGLAACMGAMLIGGATLAYFTDKDARTNRFTVAGAGGEAALGITMTETTDGSNGMVAATAKIMDGEGNVTGYSYENILPGLTYHKDVNITLDDQSIDSRLYVQLLVSNYTNLCAATDRIEVDGTGPVENLNRYLANPNALLTNPVHKYYNETTDTLSLVFDFGVLTEENASVQVFEGVKLPGELNNDEMALLEGGVDLSVKAYAIQNAGLEDAKTALAAAQTEWANEWNGN